MALPPYQPQRLPEGQYTFIISGEPELRKFTGTNKDFVTVKFFFRVEDATGNVRNHMESFLPWEPRYKDILLAIGGTEDDQGVVHLHETDEILGKSFTAEIIHEEDKKDSSKIWARIANVELPEQKKEEEAPASMSNDDEPEDDIPF